MAPLYLRLASLLVLAHLLAAQSDQKEPEPAFPALLSTSVHQVRLVSELSGGASELGGLETSEEYADFGSGKSTRVLTNKDRRQVTYLDAETALSYRYQAHECQVDKLEEQTVESLWWATARGPEGGRSMQLHGLLAVWLNFESAEKAYAPAQLVYSARRDAHRPAHRWTMLDRRAGQLVHLFFMGAPTGGLELEAASVMSADGRQLIQQVNVLALDYQLPEADAAELLGVPLGFGCVHPEADRRIAAVYPAARSAWSSVLNRHTYRLQLEAAASGGPTWSVELARATFLSTGQRRQLVLARQRNRDQDTRRVWNLAARVQYAVDERQATCQVSELDEATSGRLELDFGPALPKLELGTAQLHELLADWDGYLFVDRRLSATLDGPPTWQVYAEKPSSGSLFANRTARVVRTYADADQGGLELRAVTVWLLSGDGRHLEQSYHLHLVSASSPDSFLSVARSFDVSQECQVTPDKQPGRDYAWLEVFYPLEGRQLALVARQPDLVRLEMYAKLAGAPEQLDFTRLPRLELQVEQAGLLVRLLVLDAPPLPLLYDRHPNQSLLLVLAGSQQSQSLLAADLEHCSELCRLAGCNSMSFCPDEHRCQLSQLVPGAPGVGVLAELESRSGCSAYTLPPGETFAELERRRLEPLLAQLRRQEAQPVALPQLPEELLFGRNQSGLDGQSYAALLADYRARCLTALTGEGGRAPLLTLVLELAGRPLVLAPSELRIEGEPVQESPGARFHAGRNGLRFVAADEGGSPGARRLTGLTFDQCATACLAANCSSLSHCTGRRECITTDIFEVGVAAADPDQVQPDAECLIAQRDLLSKFRRFHAVRRRPLEFGRQLDQIQEAGECAHACLAESTFTCRAFDFCAAEPAGCYLLERRLADDWRPAAEEPAPADADCAHFARSHLLDFERLAGRRLAPSALARLPSIALPDVQADDCAEACTAQLPDCAAFQLCFGPRAPGCTAVGAGPARDGPAHPLDPDSLEPSEDCTVFLLRRDRAGSEPEGPAPQKVGWARRSPARSAVALAALALLTAGLVLLLARRPGRRGRRPLWRLHL